MAGAGATGRVNGPRGALPPGALSSGQPRAALAAEVRRVLAVAGRGDHAVIALSGGPDSTALAFLAAEVRPDLVLTLAHVRHHLRDDRADLAAVHQHAAWLGLPLRVLDVSVEPAGAGMEATARDRRYAALHTLAAEVGADWVLVGHSAEDQAETLLLRLARGSGVRGLAGMAAVTGAVVRPLLRVRRGDVRAFVAGEGLPTATDPTNADPRVRRVAVRTGVLGALAGVAGDPVGALTRLADLARADADHLDATAAEVADRLVRRYGPCLAVERAVLDQHAPAIATRVVRAMVVASRSGPLPPTAVQVHDVLALTPGTMVDLPGVTAGRNGPWLAMVPAGLARPAPVPLAVPGRTVWPATATVVVARTGAVEEAGQLVLDVGPPRPAPPPPPGTLPPGGLPRWGAATLVVAPRLLTRLELRHRRPGDRITTGAGTRKLAHLMVDLGVPRVARELVPVVAVRDQEGRGGRVLWAPGLAVEAPTNEPVTAAGGAWLHLRVEVDPHVVGGGR